MSAYAPFLLPLFLLFGYLVAIWLLPLSFLGGPGHRAGMVLIVPFVCALLLAAALLVLAPADSMALPGTLLRGGLVAGGIYGLAPIWTVPIALATAVAALVAAHYAVDVIPRVVSWVWRRIGRQAHRSATVSDVARAFTVLLLALLAGGGVAYTKASIAPVAGVVEVVSSFDLEGSPTSIAALDANRGYIAFGEGRVVRYELDDDATSLGIELAVDGLSYPRGLAIAEGRLYVIDLGELPCAQPFPQCWFGEPARELDMLQATAATVLSYPIRPDGTLGEPTMVLEDLPVVSTEHAPNSIEVGGDGALYLVVGNVDRLPLEAGLLDAIDRPNSEMLGTLVRFGPTGEDVSIITRGIRNMYELASDPDGNLYGVDNDGPAIRGWRAEQLVQLEEGADFGFPADPWRSEPAGGGPLWVLHVSGSAGLAWVEGVQDGAGFLVGGLGTIVYIGADRDAGGAYVEDETDVRVAIEGLQGFVPTIEVLDNGRILAGVFSPFAGYRNELLVLAPAQ